MEGKITLSKKQKEKIDQEIRGSFALVFQSKLSKAAMLEKVVQKAVREGKKKEKIKEILDEIAVLKREAIDSRIDALNHMKIILSEEQWYKMDKLTYK